jgi:hypothetical protein
VGTEFLKDRAKVSDDKQMMNFLESQNVYLSDYYDHEMFRATKTARS